MIRHKVLYFCKQCSQSKIILYPLEDSTDSVVFFDQTTAFESEFNRASLGVRLVSVQCRECQLNIAYLNWEFYSQDFIKDHATFSQNVIINPENLIARSALGFQKNRDLIKKITTLSRESTNFTNQRQTRSNNLKNKDHRFESHRPNRQHQPETQSQVWRDPEESGQVPRSHHLFVESTRPNMELNRKSKET